MSIYSIPPYLVNGAASVPLTPQSIFSSLLMNSLAPLQAAPAATAGATQATPPQSILLPQTNDAETQAVSSLLQNAASGVIPKLVEYLSKYATQYSQLSSAIPLVQRAVELYQNRDYPRAFVQAYQAHRAIEQVRASVPSLPSP